MKIKTRCRPFFYYRIGIWGLYSAVAKRVNQSTHRLGITMADTSIHVCLYLKYPLPTLDGFVREQFEVRVVIHANTHVRLAQRNRPDNGSPGCHELNSQVLTCADHTNARLPLPQHRESPHTTLVCLEALWRLATIYLHGSQGETLRLGQNQLCTRN
jgi:hypothetical protein